MSTVNANSVHGGTLQAFVHLKRKMFDRYSEQARRVIFFARYQASEYGSPYIETEHLLLGLIQQIKYSSEWFLGKGTSTQKFGRRSSDA